MSAALSAPNQWRVVELLNAIRVIPPHNGANRFGYFTDAIFRKHPMSRDDEEGIECARSRVPKWNG